MLIAQLSDTHLTDDGRPAGGVNTQATLRRAITRLNDLTPTPALVLITGDLSNGGQPESYHRLRALLDGLWAPYALLVGNHDDREALRAAFADQPWMPAAGFLQYSLDLGPLRVVVLDTLEAGRDGGRLCPERLRWLEAALAEAPDRPTIVALHHPPMPSGLPPFDREPLDGAEALAAVLRRAPQVIRLVCGHLHRAVTSHWQGQTVSVAPSTAFSIALTLDPGSDFTLGDDGPACALHLWRNDAVLVSHLMRV